MAKTKNVYVLVARSRKTGKETAIFSSMDYEFISECRLKYINNDGENCVYFIREYY